MGDEKDDDCLPQTSNKSGLGKKKGVGAVSKKHTSNTADDDWSRAQSDSPPPQSSGALTKMDFKAVDDKFLRRYRRVVKLRGTKNVTNRDELLQAVTKHFNAQEINEKEVITYFIYSVRNQGSILKFPPKIPS
ncbi:hypothetical protein HDU67_003307 [Dinochytrium kinnereticum]|nr:hypothetical protein HDU67_003307 [Dinochytrium kinnereticum]